MSNLQQNKMSKINGYAETGYSILISVNDDERNTIFTEQYSLIRPVLVSEFLLDKLIIELTLILRAIQ